MPFALSFEFVCYFCWLKENNKTLLTYRSNTCIYRPSLCLYHPALLLRNSRIKTSKRDQALSATSQCERRSYQRHYNARGDVIKLAFVKRKTVLGRKNDQ